MLLGACAFQFSSFPAMLPGFWVGLLHGATALLSLLASLVTDTRIYSFPNAGFSYDAGFVLGFAVAHGMALSISRSR